MIFNLFCLSTYNFFRCIINIEKDQGDILHFFFHTKFSKSHMYWPYSTSKFRPATFPVLHSHTWLVTTLLDKHNLRSQKKRGEIHANLGDTPAEVSGFQGMAFAHGFITSRGFPDYLSSVSLGGRGRESYEASSQDCCIKPEGGFTHLQGK